MITDETPLSRLHAGDAVQIEYLDDGAPDAPTVVLLHGYPDIPATWDDVLGSAADGPANDPSVHPGCRTYPRAR